MTLEKLVEYNDKLSGLPNGAMAFLACIGIAYVINRAEWISNRLIPVAMLVFGIGLCMWGAPTRNPDVEIRIWLYRGFCTGVITGFVAWLARVIVLKRLEKKLGGFNGKSHDTDHITKSKGVSHAPHDSSR